VIPVLLGIVPLHRSEAGDVIAPRPGIPEAILHALTARGFASATAYADSQPQASVAALARALAETAASAAMLEVLLVEEARATNTLERCARSLLARDLRAQLPDGWPRTCTGTDDESTCPLFLRAGVFHALAMALPDEHAEAIARVRCAMYEAIPEGWLPRDADDPALVAIFSAHWCRS
jgi:hypothetical protein